MAAAPAEEEPPKDRGFTADAGVRPACPARLDVSPDNELSLPALPAPSRDESAEDGVAVVLGGRPARCFLRGLPRIVVFHYALVLPLLLLPPPPLLDILMGRRCQMCCALRVCSMHNTAYLHLQNTSSLSKTPSSTLHTVQK